MVADELASGHSTAPLDGVFPRPNHELEGDHLRDVILVGGLFAEHMPDGAQKLTSNRNDSFVPRIAVYEALKLSVPVRVAIFTTKWVWRACFAFLA